MRFDVYLVSKGFAESRTKARRMIDEGTVVLAGKPGAKASAEVSEDDQISVCGKRMPYVGRGGIKLNAALDAFHISVTGAVAADIGASTGGFTDCLLQRGAKKIFAVDSGKGQLHPSLLSDVRVISMENQNARLITQETFGELCDIIVMDVSFISQTLLYGSVRNALKEDGVFISLIKPQFEAGKSCIGKNGIIRDKSVHVTVIKNIMETAHTAGFYCAGLMRSPVSGGDGNREYLSLFYRKSRNIDIDDICIKNLVYG